MDDSDPKSPADPLIVRGTARAVGLLEGLLVQSLLALAPLIILLGIILEKPWLAWSGVILFGVEIAAGVLYGLVMGVWLPIHTFRKWKELPLAGKILMALASGFVVLCLGGILVLW